MDSNITPDRIVTHDREKRLRYFHEHKRAFDVENFYVLNKFKKLLENPQEDCIVENGIKISLDRFHAGRFNLSYLPYKNSSKESQVLGILTFFRQIETRVGAKINYQLLEKFLNNFDFNKIIKVLMGVDARSEIAKSRLKLFIYIEDYPEKMEQAISLCGGSSEIAEIKALMVANYLLVGFDFYLDGSTAIEVYPTLFDEDLLRADVRELLGRVLPSKALMLLKACHALQIGFSKANESKVLYFHPIDSKGFADSLGNEMAKKVNAYYRNQPVMDLLVAIPEIELRKESIQRLNLYYCLS